MKKLLSATAILLLTTIAQANTDTYNANVAKSLNALATQIKAYQEQNPNATDDELNAYVEQLLSTEVSQAPIIEERTATNSSDTQEPYGLARTLRIG